MDKNNLTLPIKIPDNKYFALGGGLEISKCKTEKEKLLILIKRAEELQDYKYLLQEIEKITPPELKGKLESPEKTAIKIQKLRQLFIELYEELEKDD